MATEGADPRDELTPSEIVLLHGQRFAAHERDVRGALKLFGLGAAIGLVPAILLFAPGKREGELGAAVLIPITTLAVAVACWARATVMLVRR